MLVQQSKFLTHAMPPNVKSAGEWFSFNDCKLNRPGPTHVILRSSNKLIFDSSTINIRVFMDHPPLNQISSTNFNSSARTLYQGP